MVNIQQTLQNRFKVWANRVSANEQIDTALQKVEMSAVLKLLTQFVGKSIPFATRNGFQVIDLKPGYIKCMMPFKPNKNHFNAMYAGALFTVAELPGGILSLLNFDDRVFPVLVEYNIQYLLPAKTDVTVEFSLTQDELARIEEETLAEGKSAFELRGEIKDANQEVVARTIGSYQVRMRR